MNFDFEMRVTDGNYGVKFPNGSWDGLIGGLIIGVNIHIFCFAIKAKGSKNRVIKFKKYMPKVIYIEYFFVNGTFLQNYQMH